MLSNLVITNCSDTGILLNPFASAITVKDTLINTVTNEGINFVNENDGSQCQRVTLINCNGPFGIGTNGSISSSLFEDCHIVGCVSNLGSFTPFKLASGINNQFIRCSVKNIQNNVGDVTAFSIGSDVTSFDTCRVQGLRALGTANGYSINDTGATVENCLAIDLAGNESFGFNLTVTAAVMENCLVQAISSAVPGDAFGFSITGSGFSFIGCQAYQVTGTGFNVLLAVPLPEFLDGMLFKCGANNNSTDGFGVASFPFTLIGNCTAFNNGSFGFDIGFNSAGQYGCFASGNGFMNYSSNVPNVQPASQNTLVFARGNNFI